MLVGPLLLLGTLPVAAQVLSCAQQEEGDVLVVNRFISLLRDGDRHRLADLIRFPLPRRYPLPSISRGEFIDRYEEVFDDEFVRIIVSSGNGECGRMGWRGLQLHNGLVWFYDDGTIRNVNYESAVEERERYRLIDLERLGLHESLRDYQLPILEWETCSYRVRVDRVDGGYRYAAWNVARFHDSEPDIVIDKGTYNMEGTLGDHGYYFSNGEYKYILFVDTTSTVSAGDLEVYRTPLNGYHDVRHESKDHELLLAEQIVNTGTESRNEALLNRLRACTST
ncbi:MAG: hypothetical protein OXJ62_12170 [Spirochaetaceae bacterium]|nr:hypothetical protein [Spirochaetaceae bacterium]